MTTGLSRHVSPEPMESRGYVVRVAESVAEGLAAVDQAPPAFAVIDMRLGDGNGLEVESPA